MNARKLAASFLLVMLASLNESPQANEPRRPSKLNPTHARQQFSGALACPSQDFETFLAAFSDDTRIQRAFVHDPLESESVDANAEPGPKLVTHLLSKSQLSFPLIPSEKQQVHDGLKRTVTASGEQEMMVKLAKEDTDYQLILIFRQEGCWTLYRKQDDSL